MSFWFGHPVGVFRRIVWMLLFRNVGWPWGASISTTRFYYVTGKDSLNPLAGQAAANRRSHGGVGNSQYDRDWISSRRRLLRSGDKDITTSGPRL